MQSRKAIRRAADENRTVVAQAPDPIKTYVVARADSGRANQTIPQTGGA